jgi:hypothetical protein
MLYCKANQYYAMGGGLAIRIASIKEGKNKIHCKKYPDCVILLI